MFRYLLKVLILLIALAIGTTAYLLATQDQALNWRQLAELPDFRWPDWKVPDWERLKFWEQGAEEPGQQPAVPGAEWVTRPGEEPAEFAPFTPGVGVMPRFPPGTYFRWQDADGTWHYTPAPKPGVRNYPVATNPQQNILPAP